SYRVLKLRRKVARENFLRDVYELYEVSVDRPSVAHQSLLARGITLSALASKSGKSLSEAKKLARAMQASSLVRLDDRGGGTEPVCTLTQKGIEEAWNVV